MFSDTKETNEELIFDTLEIDSNINREESNGVFNKENNTFKYAPNLSKDDAKKIKPDDNLPKYFAKILNKNFKYIGILTNQLKRDQYGYSFFDNNDEFLGELKNEARDGFGIYKFNTNEDEPEIYIGEYKNNQKSGKGLYLHITKILSDDNNKDLLTDFDCAIGKFEEDTFKEGKIFTIKDYEKTLYVGKMNEIGYPCDNEAMIMEGNDKIFVGVVKEGKMIEGRNIILDEKGKKKAYYFCKTDEVDNPYNFDYLKEEENDNKNIEKGKNIQSVDYKKEIQGVYDKVNDFVNKFKNFNFIGDIQFENEMKDVLIKDVDKLISV